MAGFTSQARMILDHTDMTTFELLHKFAEACETEVHLLEAIIDQCERGIRLKRELRDKSIDKKEEYNYLYFYQNVPDSLQISNYPDLAYAAIQMKRTESDTFEQYADIRHENGFVSSKVIDRLLEKPLLSDETDHVLPRKLTDFIIQRGKKANVIATPSREIENLIDKIMSKEKVFIN